MDAARRNIGHFTRKLVDKTPNRVSEVRLEAKKATADYLMAARSRFAEREKKFTSVGATVNYSKSVSAEQLIELKYEERARKKEESALKDLAREEREAKKREREKITCKVPDCKMYENSRGDKKKNPFRWCDYCDEFGICGPHYDDVAQAALLAAHELSCPMRPRRSRKAARKD